MVSVAITLREITQENAKSVLALRTSRDQERFVSSVASSWTEAAEYPHANPWFRAVYNDRTPVGFVMLSWDVQPQPPEINGPWFLWKLLIDERHQGLGHGRAVVQRVVELVRSHGGIELLTSHVPGDDGSGGFYGRLNFVPTGEVDPKARSSCASICAGDVSN